ncbi:MAG: fasciclin domain-containing protein [Acidobacteriota bacterium]
MRTTVSTSRRNVLLTAAIFLLGVTLTASTAFAGHHKKKESKDIVAVAVGAGSFNTLAAALEAADLVGALQGDGPFTVFAPTDDAFAALPDGTLDTLLKPENRDQLTAILTYHVVAGKVPAKDVVKMDSAETLNGQSLNFEVVDGNVKVNDATVVKADVGASNGVIHVIDSVLLPAAN